MKTTSYRKIPKRTSNNSINKCWQNISQMFSTLFISAATEPTITFKCFEMFLSWIIHAYTSIATFSLYTNKPIQ